MKANLEDISAVKKKVTVEIEAKEVDNRLDKAYREYGKKAKIHGFRPGKIPRRILENYFAEQVVEDVTREIVNDTLAKAMEETKAVPISMPVIENESLKVNQTFKYSALVEVRPKFELKDYKGLQVEKEIYSVNDQDVEKHLREIRETHGKLINIDEDRGVAEGDYVILEYEGFEGEKALEGIKSHNFLLRIGSNDFHPDFEKALIGIHKGDQTEITVDFEDSYYHAKLAGKSVDFKVKVIEIKKMELPELNDEFASKLGADFDSLEALKEKIKEDLTTREEKRIDKELKERILKQISDQVSFELPESLVEAEIGYAIENIKQNLIRAGSNMEKAGLREEKLKQDFRPAAEKRVKNMLILGEIAEKDDINISESDLDEGYTEMAKSLGQDAEVLRQYYEANNLVDSYRGKLLEEKTLNYLVKSANILEVSADEIQGEGE